MQPSLQLIKRINFVNWNHFKVFINGISKCWNLGKYLSILRNCIRVFYFVQRSSHIYIHYVFITFTFRWLLAPWNAKGCWPEWIYFSGVRNTETGKGCRLKSLNRIHFKLFPETCGIYLWYGLFNSAKRTHLFITGL